MVDQDFIIRREELDSRVVLNKRVETAESFVKVLEKKVKETDELSEICLIDRDKAEEKYRHLKLELNENYGTYVRRISKLPKNIRGFLWDLVPKKSSERKPNEKIIYHRKHSDPKGLENFLKKLSRIDWVDEIRTGSQIYQGHKKTILKNISKENEYYKIEGFYVKNNFGKTIYVYTTAEDKNQALFIKCYLDDFFK